MHERPGSSGGCVDGRSRQRRAARNMQKQRATDCRYQTEQSEPIKSTRVVAGQVFHNADIPRAEETSEIADRVDPGNACCKPGATEKHCSHGEKRALEAIKTHRGVR